MGYNADKAAPREPSSSPTSPVRSVRSQDHRRSVTIQATGAAVICMGLAVHFTVYGSVGDFAADALYAVLAYLVVSFLVPRVRPQVAATVSFVVCAVIEVAQLSPGPAALAEVFPPARLILGTTFAPLDLVAYAVGVSAALTCDLLIQRRLAGSSAQTSG